MGKKDIFRFEIAVNDLVDFQENEAAEELFGEPAYELQRKSAKIVRLNKFVEIDA